MYSADENALRFIQQMNISRIQATLVEQPPPLTADIIIIINLCRHSSLMGTYIHHSRIP